MSLVNELIKGLLPEEEKKKVVAVYGGGFKPPTSGHFEVVKQALKENPEIDKFIILIGGKPRNGITPDESILIWDIYKTYLPFKVEVKYTSVPPIKGIYNYAKEHPDEEVLFVIGAREGNEDDFADIATRTKSLDKYPNLNLRTIVTQGGVSGTAARNASKISLEKFKNFVPSELSDEEVEEVYNIVANKIQENITESKQVGTLYHYTSAEGLKGILQSNSIKASEEYYLGNDLYFVSFTRNKNFHKKGSAFDVKIDYRITLDGDKLSNKYKIKPFAYIPGWNYKDNWEYEWLDDEPESVVRDFLQGTGDYDEQEERIFFKKPGGSITNIKDYILKVDKVSELTEGRKKKKDPEDGKAAPYGSGYKKLNENITKSQLDTLETYADKLFAKLGIDIEFTRHFLDRANDKRNIKPISIPELMGMFKRLHRKHGKPLSKIDNDFDAVVKDFNSNINIPFAINVTPNDIDLVAKTVMRKKDFKTSTPVIALNENATYTKKINLVNRLATLTQYMLDKGMNIEPLPKLEFIDGDVENASEFLGKTAYYDPNTQTIVLYTEGRHPKDITRSYAHEMIHHIQNLEGRLGNITTTNTQEDDNLNDIEAEANLKGTMTFRNWTDSLNEIQTPANEKDVDPKELSMGIKVEMEHTDDKAKAKIIALQHLAEDPKYYTKLKSLDLEEAIVGEKIECDGCGWSWNIVDGGNDLFICHKCGHNNKSLSEGKKKDPFGLLAYAQELGRLREEENEYKVYLDMDGVLADFDQRFRDISGMEPREFENKYGTKAFWNLIDEENKISFWVGIPEMPGAKALVDAVKDYNFELLTSPSAKKQSYLGKILWVRNHKDLFSGKPRINFKKAKEKHLVKPQLAKTDILIDDREDTIGRWNAAGGTGIVYKNISQVLNDLKKLGL